MAAPVFNLMETPKPHLGSSTAELLSLAQQNYEAFCEIASILKREYGSIFQEVMSSEHDLPYLTPGAVNRLDLIHHFGMQKQIMTGVTWNQAVSLVDLTEKNYYQSTHAQVADLVMEWLRKMIPDQDAHVVDTNTGAGALSFAALKKGFKLLRCIDRDSQVLLSAKELCLQFFPDQASEIDFIVGDSREEFSKHLSRPRPYPTIAIVDPSWSGGISSTHDQPVGFDILGSTGPKLVSNYLNSGYSHVIIKLPNAVTIETIISQSIIRVGNRSIQGNWDVLEVDEAFAAPLANKNPGYYKSKEKFVLYWLPQTA